MNPIILDKVRGCMLGGAVGDALGYPVMNLNIDDIRKEHGENGISEYLLDENGKAGISDITQLSLFTANKTFICLTPPTYYYECINKWQYLAN